MVWRERVGCVGGRVGWGRTKKGWVRREEVGDERGAAKEEGVVERAQVVVVAFFGGRACGEGTKVTTL